MPKFEVYEAKKPLKPLLALCTDCIGEVELRFVDENGGAIKGGCILTFCEDTGQVVLTKDIDEDLAKAAGLRLDDDGQIIVGG